MPHEPDRFGAVADGGQPRRGSVHVVDDERSMKWTEAGLEFAGLGERDIVEAPREQLTADEVSRLERGGRELAAVLLEVPRFRYHAIAGLHLLIVGVVHRIALTLQALAQDLELTPGVGGTLMPKAELIGPLTDLAPAVSQALELGDLRLASAHPARGITRSGLRRPEPLRQVLRGGVGRLVRLPQRLTVQRDVCAEDGSSALADRALLGLTCAGIREELLDRRSFLGEGLELAQVGQTPLRARMGVRVSDPLRMNQSLEGDVYAGERITCRDALARLDAIGKATLAEAITRIDATGFQWGMSDGN